LACLYAIVYYTGAGSNKINCGAAMEARKANGEIEIKKYTSEKYVSFIYYLILALSKIEFFWGIVERWINLKKEDNDFNIYTPGNIVTWIQFSSAS
jgi:hypothetical protein